MINRLSRNFKVPLVYGGEWKNSQTFQKWDPISKRLVTVNCCSVSATALPTPPPTTNYQFIRVSGSVGVDPGSGNFTTNTNIPPNVVLQFNKTDKNSLDASSYLSKISGTATTLTITKDGSNYSVFTINSSTDMGTYWSFACTISSFVGIVNVGDTVTLTYA